MRKRQTFEITGARAFQEHIFGIGWESGCCNAMSGRYCASGLALKVAYDDAHRERAETEAPPVDTRQRQRIDTSRGAG